MRCLTCWVEIAGPRAVYTAACRHVFCIPCSNEAFSRELACPLCDTVLPKDGVVEFDVRPDATALRDASAATLGLGPPDLCAVLRAGLDFWEGHRRNEDARREALVRAAEVERDKAAEALRKMTAALEQEKLTSRKLQAEIAQLRLGHADIEMKYAEKARAARKVADLYVDLKKVHHRLRTDLLEAKHSCGGNEIAAAERAHNLEAREIHHLLPPKISAAGRVDAHVNGADSFVADAAAPATAATTAATAKARENDQNKRRAWKYDARDPKILGRHPEESARAEPRENRRGRGPAAAAKATSGLSYGHEQNFGQSPAAAHRPRLESNFERSRARRDLERSRSPPERIERASKSLKRQRRASERGPVPHQYRQRRAEESPRSGFFETSPATRGHYAPAHGAAEGAHYSPAYPLSDRAPKRRRATPRTPEGPSARNHHVSNSPRARVFDLNPGLRKRHNV